MVAALIPLRKRAEEEAIAARYALDLLRMPGRQGNDRPAWLDIATMVVAPVTDLTGTDI